MLGERGVSTPVAVVLLIALTVVLAALATVSFTSFDPGSEPKQVSLSVSVDEDDGELVIEHTGGGSVETSDGTDIVVTDGDQRVTVDGPSDGTFDSGDELRLPLSRLGDVDEVAVVVERSSGSSQRLGEYSLPDGIAVGPVGWTSVAGTAGATRAPYDTAAHSAPRTTRSGELSAVAVGEDGTIYYQRSGEDSFHAYDPDTGSDRWTLSRAPTSNPVVVDGTVYLAFTDASGKHTLAAYDAESGSLNYETEVAAGLDWLATDGDRLYATAGGYVYAFDIDDGSRVWRHDHGTTLQAPTVADGTLVMSEAGGLGASGRLALNATDGSVVWTRSAGQSYHSPAVADGTAFTKDGTELVALSVADGSDVWRTDLGEQIVGTVAVSDGTVYATTDENELVAVDADSGTVQWREQIRSAGSWDPTVDRNTKLTVADDTVYVGVDNGWSSELYAVDRSDGSVRWHESLSSGAEPVAFPIGDEIVIWFDT